jgi:hypothetical protein
MQRHTFSTLETYPTARSPGQSLGTCHKELTKEATREVARALIEIIDGRGGMAAFDEILIDLDRRFKKLGERASVAHTLLAL